MEKGGTNMIFDKCTVDTVAPIGSFDGTPAQLAQLVLDQIVTYPETHDQRDWFSPCGTTGCVSGWANMFAKGYFETANYAPETSGRELLGLTPFDAYWLFYCTTNQQAQHALKALANGERIDWETVGSKYDTMRHMYSDRARLAEDIRAQVDKVK
jgi:hypothetical protein